MKTAMYCLWLLVALSSQLDRPNFEGLVSDILVTQEGKVLLADSKQDEIKVINPGFTYQVIDTLSLGTPWSMAQLANGTVVVTSEHEPKMSFLRLGDSGLQLERTILPGRHYRGVAQCGNGFLYASAPRNADLDASVDIINREGDVVETVLSGADLPDLDRPLYLTCHGRYLYISDWTSHKLIAFNVDTRQVTSLFGDTDLSALGLYQPRAAAIDRNDNMYLATGGSACNEYYSEEYCVLQVSPIGWSEVYDHYYYSGGDFPYGVAVSDTLIYLSWVKHEGKWHTSISSYPLAPPLTEPTI